ncbi:Tn3 family transposase [Paraburkholderia sacchari]|uniref:Tn3 family transposase n=1 Tax=Paraburkholderia sacchari TaxID=159450 RepID=UPI003D9923EA
MWNTTHMQRALEEILAATGKPLESEQLRRIAPTHLEGINLRGTFNFPLARYAHRILPSLETDLRASTAGRRA